MAQAVLAVPVPQVNPFILARTAFYDASFLPADASFVNSHITLLAPWLPAPRPQDCAEVARIAAETPAFTVRLARIGQFPDGLIHLLPDPPEPLAELTARLCEAFPRCAPYRRRYSSITPHLTLDQHSAQVDIESVRAMLGDLIPTEVEVDRIDLQWWANHDCHLVQSWSLGG